MPGVSARSRRCRPLDLAIRAGDFYAILGPSGCGKTTLLRMIGGFERQSAGRLLIAGRDVTGLPPERRPTNMVFQGYGLFPHMNVAQNIGYGLRVAKVGRAEIERRVTEVLSLVQIDGFADRAIDKLSGGQQQRVSLARALVMRPQILLLDEPLAALDLKLRASMQEELRRLHREIGGTFVFVTHDQGEAMALANRIAIMRDGAIEQEGTPEEIYSRPTSAFVAGFIGEANLLAGRRRAGRIALDAGPEFDDPGPDGPVTLMVRPENVVLGAAARDCDARVDARVEDMMFLGPHLRCRLRLVRQIEAVVQMPLREAPPGLAAGAAIEAGWRAADQHVIDGEVPA